MAGRYRGPTDATPTANEFILERAQLVQDIGDYMARVAALNPLPLEYLEGIRYLQRAAELSRPDELPVYRAKFKELTSA